MTGGKSASASMSVVVNSICEYCHGKGYDKICDICGEECYVCYENDDCGREEDYFCQFCGASSQ